MKSIEVTLCMGSSCFSRGSNRSLILLNEFIKNNHLENNVHVKGCLCTSNCQDGPNFKIEDKEYKNVDPTVVIDLLKYHLGPI
jgi:NADH:ubiquinone oxidoreductase subunit E